MADPHPDDPKAKLLRTRDDLLEPFYDACKPPERHLIGAEAERFGLDAETNGPLPYEGERSVAAVLRALVAGYGWKPTPEVEGGPLIALGRSGASITLEPGGQLELSGAPLEDLHAIAAETSEHLRELAHVSGPLGLRWMTLGFHPFARQIELPWVPKLRYNIMRRYLRTRGEFGIDMMRRTATVQVNFDYASEEAAMRSLRVSLRLSPLVTALFANSPFFEGKLFGGKSYRARVWLSVDPHRQGLLPQILERGLSFSEYVDWALRAPMFMFKRGGVAVENTGQTFESFLQDGFGAHRPTLGDWETHLNTMFPEVRLKRTLELRGADAQAEPLATALPALWTGLLYDAAALDGAEELCRDWHADELEALRPSVAELGLGASFRGRPLAELAERLLDLAMGGLERRGRVRDGRDERVHLEGLVRLAERGLSPADLLTEGLRADDRGLRQAILSRLSV